MKFIKLGYIGRKGIIWVGNNKDELLFLFDNICKV